MQSNGRMVYFIKIRIILLATLILFSSNSKYTQAVDKQFIIIETDNNTTNNIYQDLPLESLPKEFGPSGFLISTEQRMEELGYLAAFHPIQYQINTQNEADYRETFKSVYNTFSAMIKGVYDYYIKQTEANQINAIDILLSSSNTFILKMEDEELYSKENYTSFKDAEKFTIEPIMALILRKWHQLNHGKEAEGLLESSNAQNALIKLQEATRIGLQEMRNQTYSVWYLLMVRSMVERQIRQTYKAIEGINSTIDKLNNGKNCVTAKMTKSLNISAEQKNYEISIESAEDDILAQENNANKLRRELKSNVERYLYCLRAPNDPNYSKGYFSQYGLFTSLSYNLGYSQHPRVLANQQIIYPLIEPCDVEWGYKLLLDRLLEYDDFIDENKPEFNELHNSIFGKPYQQN